MWWPFKRRKHVALRRLPANSATETLMIAMEEAESMETVVVLYETKEGAPIVGGIFMPRGATLSKVNWMLDQAKRWLHA